MGPFVFFKDKQHLAMIKFSSARCVEQSAGDREGGHPGRNRGGLSIFPSPHAAPCGFGNEDARL
jgi:hypothetical protein